MKGLANAGMLARVLVGIAAAGLATSVALCVGDHNLTGIGLPACVLLLASVVWTEGFVPFLACAFTLLCWGGYSPAPTTAIVPGLWLLIFHQTTAWAAILRHDTWLTRQALLGLAFRLAGLLAATGVAMGILVGVHAWAPRSAAWLAVAIVLLLIGIYASARATQEPDTLDRHR